MKPNTMLYSAGLLLVIILIYCPPVLAASRIKAKDPRKNPAQPWTNRRSGNRTSRRTMEKAGEGLEETGEKAKEAVDKIRPDKK